MAELRKDYGFSDNLDVTRHQADVVYITCQTLTHRTDPPPQGTNVAGNVKLAVTISRLLVVHSFSRLHSRLSSSRP
ncbi:hypothetical protein PoB_007033600 [Plakobranchus ocellatus]|uniref:Uncharacterized protein n=1 Tax=Plakobranchus ocellatus TaxID=259542 RepID=A0AAV4DIZ5_9GAST|nr:hypothetical protein PoB_007033600 [Plakobranchus ocellatus]